LLIQKTIGFVDCIGSALFGFEMTYDKGIFTHYSISIFKAKSYIFALLGKKRIFTCRWKQLKNATGIMGQLKFFSVNFEPTPKNKK